MKKILVLGGTGALVRYAVKDLVDMGYFVDVVALDTPISNNKNLKYTVANAMDDKVVENLLKNGYDAVVDFMTYHVPQFKIRMNMFLENTNQYIFLSSCRVFANGDVVTEDSPKLLNVSDDLDYLSRKETEYSLYKAIEEDMLKNSGYKNYTIVRPATTYSTGRFQLVTLEANSFVLMAQNNQKVLLPYEAMDCEATMSWGGDVGRMIARIVLNENAYGNDYNVATAEHHTWREIASYYEELIGLKYELVDKETYLKCIATERAYPFAKYQLEYARMFNRVTDNSKILTATGMKQKDLMPLYEGLKTELSNTDIKNIAPNSFVIDNMNNYLKENLL